MKRISAVLAAVAMLALTVAGPASAAKGGVPNNAKPAITCTSTQNADGTVTKTCTNAKAGPEDGGVTQEIDED